MTDLKLVARRDQRGHDTILGMCVNDRARVSHQVGVHEQGCALALFEFFSRRRPVQDLLVQRLHKQIFGLFEEISNES